MKWTSPWRVMAPRLGRLPLLASLAAVLPLLAPSLARADNLTLVTWNLEWLLTPETDRALRGSCQRQQPRSDERALPCTPGRRPPPARRTADYDALARTADRLLRHHGADVVAVQEVDGPQAAQMVFRDGWRVACFTARAHPQKVGFVVRDGVPYRCNPPLSALDVDGSSRDAADITLYPASPRPVRLLSVHLKSGCFQGKLDRTFNPCERLREQVPVLEAWVDARVREGVSFAILGDFNRLLDKDERLPAGDDESAPLSLLPALSDDRPRGARLSRATEGQPYVPCTSDDTYSRYIDDVLLSDSLRNRTSGVRLVRVPYARDEEVRQVSDHCPVGARLLNVAP